MDQDTYKTKVIFRKFPEGDIVALFPEEPGSINVNTCNSYIHCGQHGIASTAIAYWTKPARPDEYADLLEELQSLGYNLTIIKHFHPNHRYARQQAIDDMK